MRADFCSRPPRVANVDRLWTRAVRSGGLDVVDVDSLIRLKETRRQRDYAIIGALAETAGLRGNSPDLALRGLQDYETLRQAVRRWPARAKTCDRPAVRLLRENAPRAAVVAAIAVEQDTKAQQDRERIAALQEKYGDFPREFERLRASWRKSKTPLRIQHRELVALAKALRGSQP